MDYKKYNLDPQSHTYKDSTSFEESEQVDIPKYNTVRKKKSLGQKFQETFLEEDMAIVRGHVLHDVAIPSLKRLFRDSIVTCIDMLLFGTARSDSKLTGGSYVNYSGYSIKGTGNSGGYRMDSNRSKHNVDILYFQTKQDAFNALQELCELIDNYDDHFVTVATYYQMNENDGTYTWADSQWGWSELGEAKVEGPVRVPVKDGNNEVYQSMYYILMPSPIPKPNRR